MVLEGFLMSVDESRSAILERSPERQRFAMTGHEARDAHAVIDLDAALKRNEK